MPIYMRAKDCPPWTHPIFKNERHAGKVNVNVAEQAHISGGGHYWFCNMNGPDGVEVIPQYVSGNEDIISSPLMERQLYCGGDLTLAPGVMVLKRSTMGCSQFFTLWCHPSDINQGLLPTKIDLTLAEKIVLQATCSLKNTYGGRTNIRFHEANEYTGISQRAWDAAVAALTAKGVLDKRGAVTVEGRNVRPDGMGLWELGRESGWAELKKTLPYGDKSTNPIFEND